MCGIAGKVNWTSTPGTSAVLKMCSKLTHRGPDDSGIISLKKITLGHKRLSIIDLSERARQPMTSEGGRYYIVYNGEVYNFKDLRRELEGVGVVFKTSSDTEVVLYSYIQWGVKCLDKFNGMFAFAVWDNHKEELFLVRDRFGKKPLYYYIDPNKGIVFASELTALICDKDVPKKMSNEALNCYLSLGYILSPMSLYEDVLKLEPATYLLMSNAGNSVNKIRYWNYADAFGTKTAESENNVAVNVLGLLEESVKRRMISDVPVGAFLSGGVDSSAIVGIMKKYHSGPLHTFSMGFDKENYNELYYANKAAKWFGTDHHDKICRIEQGRSLVDDAIDAYDEPFGDNSLIPMVEVSQIASSYVKVVLSGDGADEMFAGYLTHKADKYYYYARHLPLFMKKLLIRFGESFPAGGLKKLDWRYKQKQFFYGTIHSPEKAHYLWRIIFHPEERVEILGKEYKELVYDTDPFFVFKKYYDNVKDLHWLDRNLYVDGMTWLPDDILVKVDRASMKSSIEARCPYLDIDLVNYAASIPPDLKLKGFQTKYILKKSLGEVLPDFVLNRAKSGFNAPVGAWLGADTVDEFKVFNEYVFNRKAAGGGTH